MIIEQLMFIIIAFALFVYIFYKLIKENNTTYVPILAIQALGIGIKFVDVCIGKKTINVISIIITYILSIIIPIFIITMKKIDNNISEKIVEITAKIYLIFGNTKNAKNILLKLVDKNPESYIGHKLLGQIYEKEGGQRKAVDEYAQAIDINKNVAVSVEVFNDSIDVLYIDDCFVHSNHFLRGEYANKPSLDDGSNSCFRYEKARELLLNMDIKCLTDLKSILDYRSKDDTFFESILQTKKDPYETIFNFSYDTENKEKVFLDAYAVGKKVALDYNIDGVYQALI